MIADPFHLLDCSMTSEGGAALVVAAADRLKEVASTPVYLLGSGSDHFGPAYQYPPAWDLSGRNGGPVLGRIGESAADRAFRRAGLRRDDVDVLELNDPFSFEIIRQLETFGFCGPGEGGPFVEAGHIDIGGSHPVTTDGGTMSFSHAGASPQMFQRVIRGVQQVRGEAGPRQVPGAEVALCSGGGAGALFTTVALVGREPA
jgi:acetyl-CoA acetyltransferase